MVSFRKQERDRSTDVVKDQRIVVEEKKLSWNGVVGTAGDDGGGAGRR